MTYIKYIFSDKKASVYWISLLMILLIFHIINLIVNFDVFSKFSIGDFVKLYKDVIIYSIIYIGFYTSGYLNFRLQKQFEYYYNSKIDIKSLKEVEIYQESFALKPLGSNHNAKINIKPRLDSFIIFKIDEILVVFGKTYDFGIFRRHIEPFQINLSNERIDKLKFVSKPKISELEVIDNNLIIKFKEGYNSINKLIIKEFKACSH